MLYLNSLENDYEMIEIEKEETAYVQNVGKNHERQPPGQGQGHLHWRLLAVTDPDDIPGSG